MASLKDESSINKKKHVCFYVFSANCCFVLLFLGLIGCGTSGAEPEEPIINMDSVVVTVNVLPDDKPLISKGQELQLEALAFNSDSTEINGDTLTWSSSDESVLSVSNSGLVTGIGMGRAMITAEIDGKTDDIELLVVDLTGIWVGGEAPDTVTYTLTQTGNSVEGVFQSIHGFPPITDVNTGTLTGSLVFTRYQHTLELTTEDNCILQITGSHFIQVQDQDEIVLFPGSGLLSSTNCAISGRIDFATLRRQ